MMEHAASLIISSAFCWGSLVAADATASGNVPSRPASVQGEAPSGARVVHYGEQDVIPLRARVRFTTLIVLPKTEQIMDFVCGDKEFWIVNGAQNFAYVKPAKEGGRTDLNLVAASGNVYSFLLSEVSDGAIDLNVFVELRDAS